MNTAYQEGMRPAGGFPAYTVIMEDYRDKPGNDVERIGLS
jgi:hypothetical protein